MKKILIKNLGTIVSGDIKKPILDAEVIYAEDGVIKYIGAAKAELEAEANTVVDAKGLDISPGLVDAHAHPPINDYMPLYKATDFATNFVASGNTGMISVGNTMMPGVPPTVSGTKAMAIVGKQVWENNRPSGFKIHGGALMLVEGLEDKDFAEMAAEGINVVGEVGMSPLKDIDKLADMVKLAQKHGMVVTAHSGGPSDKDCASYNADDLFKINPDVICKLNGGPTPMSDEDIKRVVEEGDFYYDLIAHGNLRILLDVYKLAADNNKTDKLMLGTNTPSMAGYSPLGLWTNIAALSNYYQDVHPSEFIAMASGNVADCYGLDHGKIKEGYKLDVIFLDGFDPDTCPFKTLQSGNMCSTSNVIIDGNLVMPHCKNVPGVSRNPEFINK